MSPVYSSLSPSSSSAAALTREETQSLIPGLPNDVAALILSFIPYSYQHIVKRVSKPWRSFLSSNAFITLRHTALPRRLSHLLCIFPQDPSIESPYLFDPVHRGWRCLPPLPPNPHVYGLCNFRAVAVGPHLYVIGGALFDTRSFPLDRPCPTDAVFRFSFVTFCWESLAPMITPRGSFACAALPNSQQILVAGGGSRHNAFGLAGSRVSSVERYDIQRNQWLEMEGLPRSRAGCVGFVVENEGDEEFWVMGGYGGSRTVGGVFPVDEYYKDAVVMELEHGGYSGRWREVGSMWTDRETFRLGQIAVLEDEVDGGQPAVFMLYKRDIFRYNMALNEWQKESSVPRNAPRNSTFSVVASNGELHVLTLKMGYDLVERRSRQQKRAGTIFDQVYHPKKKTWRILLAKPPFHNSLDFNTAVICPIQL